MFVCACIEACVCVCTCQINTSLYFDVHNRCPMRLLCLYCSVLWAEGQALSNFPPLKRYKNIITCTSSIELHAQTSRWSTDLGLGLFWVTEWDRDINGLAHTLYSDRTRHFANRCDITAVRWQKRLMETSQIIVVTGEKHGRPYYCWSCTRKHTAPFPV